MTSRSRDIGYKTLEITRAIESWTIVLAVTEAIESKDWLEKIEWGDTEVLKDNESLEELSTKWANEWRKPF